MKNIMVSMYLKSHNLVEDKNYNYNFKCDDNLVYVFKDMFTLRFYLNKYGINYNNYEIDSIKVKKIDGYIIVSKALLNNIITNFIARSVINEKYTEEYINEVHSRGNITRLEKLEILNKENYCTQEGASYSSNKICNEFHDDGQHTTCEICHAFMLGYCGATEYCKEHIESPTVDDEDDEFEIIDLDNNKSKKRR